MSPFSSLSNRQTPSYFSTFSSVVETFPGELSQPVPNRCLPLYFYHTWHLSFSLLLSQDPGCPFIHSLIGSTHIYWAGAGDTMASWWHVTPDPIEKDDCHCLPVWLNKPLWNDWWSCFHVPPGLCPWRSVGLEHSLQSAQLASFLVRLSTALSLPAPALSSSSPRFSLSIAFITVETTLSLGLFVCLFSLEWNPLKSRDLAFLIAHRDSGTSTCLAHAW